MDVLRSGAPAVMVPFEERAETEQRMRTERLAARGALDLVEERDLSARTLAAAVDRAALRTSRPAPPFDMRGAERSAERILELAQGHALPRATGEGQAEVAMTFAALQAELDRWSAERTARNALVA